MHENLFTIMLDLKKKTKQNKTKKNSRKKSWSFKMDHSLFKKKKRRRKWEESEKKEERKKKMSRKRRSGRRSHELKSRYEALRQKLVEKKVRVLGKKTTFTLSLSLYYYCDSTK